MNLSNIIITIGLICVACETNIYFELFDDAVVAGKVRDHGPALEMMEWDERISDEPLGPTDRILAGGVLRSILSDQVPGPKHCVKGFMSLEQATYLNTQRDIYAAAKEECGGECKPDVGWNNHGGFKRYLARGDGFWSGPGLLCSDFMKEITQ